MNKLTDVDHALARLEEHVERLTPAAPVQVWLCEREGGEIVDPATGERMSQQAFDRLHPGVPRLTFRIHHARGEDWLPGEPEGEDAAAGAGWPRAATLAGYQRIAQEEGR